jgi:soluble lytic murein transglycosylase
MHDRVSPKAISPARRSSIAALLLAMAAGGALAQHEDGESPADAWAEQRLEFQAALELARAGEPPLVPDSEALQRYPIYVYLQAERIAGALASEQQASGAADAAASRFLADHDGEPVASPLRYAWLASLAHRERWDELLHEYRPAIADARIRCQYLRARIGREDLSGLAPLIVQEWLTAQQLPLECEPVFQWLRDEGALTDDLIERRVRMLLENGESGFARIVMGRLPEDRVPPLARWADLLESPAAAIDAYIATPAEAFEPQALLSGWSRLSRDDPDAALGRYEPIVAAADASPEPAGAYALALALGLAWDRRPEALHYFAVAEGELDDYALEWRARAALWSGSWELVGSSIAAMSQQQRETARWRYWAARAAGEQGDRRSANALFESLLRDDNYYSAMAAAYLRRRIEPHPEALPVDGPTLDVLAGDPGFVRARELRLCNLPVAALREWREAFGRLDREARRQSIHLAAQWQWYDLAVASATSFGVFNDYTLLYPTPFTEEVEAAARATDLDAGLLYAVIRQESLFRADAVSSAGAHGLMQLRPGTAESLLRELGESPRGQADLLEAHTNIRLGAAELERLLERYDGQLAVALAAYNAGPNAVDRWLPAQALDADIWIENIPYNETRDYVRRVFWNHVVYGWLENGRAQETRAWLGVVSPKRR